MRSFLMCATAACLVLSCNSSDKDLVAAIPTEPVASLEMFLTQRSPNLVGDTAFVRCVAHAKDGHVIENAPITFSSSHTLVANVSQAGRILLGGAGSTVIMAQSGAATASDSMTVLSANTVADVKVQPMSLDTGQVVPVSYTVLNPRGTIITNVPPATFSSAAPQVAFVSSDGVVRGVAYGSTTLTVTVDTVTRTAPVTVSPWPQEPAGFTKVTERDFSKIATSPTDTAGIDGWDAHEESMWPHISIVSDPTAPRSPPSVLQALYPAGTPGGSPDATPGRLVRNIPDSPARIYFSVWVKLSSNWQAHPTGTNKVLYVWINGQPRFFLSAEGQTATNLAPTGRLQGTPDDRLRGREALRPNVDTSKRVLPGTWQRWEVVLTANTPGVQNGGFQLWIDGIQVCNYSDVAYLAAGETTTFTIMDVEPIWGGAGGVLAETQTMDFDHIYVSKQ